MEIIRLSESGSEEALHKAVNVLNHGGIVLYPTDTLYGLAVDATNHIALGRLRTLKGREKKKPISIVVPDVEDIDAHAHLHENARPLAERHLPGALTLVLPGKPHLPEELMLNGQVGVRVPADAFSRALARAFGRPITATSANKAGLQTPGSVEAILTQFGPDMERIDLAIDDGERAGKGASTVITFVDGVPYVIREGALSRDELGI